MFKILWIILVLSITFAISDSQDNFNQKKQRIERQAPQEDPNTVQLLEETPHSISSINTDNFKQFIQRTLRKFKSPNGQIVFGLGQYGNYSYTDPNGKLHVVEFKADENGN